MTLATATKMTTASRCRRCSTVWRSSLSCSESTTAAAAATGDSSCLSLFVRMQQQRPNDPCRYSFSGGFLRQQEQQQWRVYSTTATTAGTGGDSSRLAPGGIAEEKPTSSDKSTSTNQKQQAAAPPPSSSGVVVMMKETPRSQAAAKKRLATTTVVVPSILNKGSSPTPLKRKRPQSQSQQSSQQQQEQPTSGHDGRTESPPNKYKELYLMDGNGNGATDSKSFSSDFTKTTVSSASSLSAAASSESNSLHPAHHYLNGGTPCDPPPSPFHLAEYGEESLYTLVLLRHGESEWNSQNRYTGWCDVNLTRQGEREARTAGRLLYENKIELDHAFTSVLKRASFSCNMALNMAQQHWVPVTKTWRFNERHYGALQGYPKDTAWQVLGLDQELVMQMRRAYHVRPPRMEDDHPYWHGNDRRYRQLSPQQLERSRHESLKDCADRIMPFFNSVVVPSMRAGNKCIIVSHANTIRTLIKQIDGISDEDIKGMTIPTGIPLLYRLDKYMRPVDPHIELEFRYMVEPKGYTWGTSRKHGFHGVYLGDLQRLQEIQRKRDATNRDWQRIILRNIGKSLGWDLDDDATTTATSGANSSFIKDNYVDGAGGPKVIEIRQLWWQVHTKMQQQADYSNMLLLVKMEDFLEDLMNHRKQRYMTRKQFEMVVDKLHLDATGKIVEPFVDLSSRHDREERQRKWYESLALDVEEECLIK